MEATSLWMSWRKEVHELSCAIEVLTSQFKAAGWKPPQVAQPPGSLHPVDITLRIGAANGNWGAYPHPEFAPIWYVDNDTYGTHGTRAAHATGLDLDALFEQIRPRVEQYISTLRQQLAELQRLEPQVLATKGSSDGNQA